MKTTSTLQPVALPHMLLTKLLATSCILLFSLFCAGQEICNNGIDDDGDALVDINDSDCICTNIVPLTDYLGNPCRGLDLFFEYPEASSFQWYKDGVAIEGETSSTLRVTRWAPTGNGTYQVYADTPTGCIASEPYVAERDEYTTELEPIYFCAGDTVLIEIEGYSKEFTLTGRYAFKTLNSQGCDSTIRGEVIMLNSTWNSFSENLCKGSTYTSASGNITATETGTYEEILQQVNGCDSVLTYYLSFIEHTMDTVRINDTICAGGIFRYYDFMASEAGTYVTEICETTIIIDLEVDIYSCETHYITGSIFYDTNRNGLKDAGENGINTIPLHVSPDSNLIHLSNEGYFLVYAELFESYEIGIDLSNEPMGKWEITTGQESYTIDEFFPNPSNEYKVNFGLVLTEDVNAGNITHNPYNSRCNTTEQLRIRYQNQGVAIAGDDYVELTLELDTLFNIISSTPEPVNIEGNKYTFHLDELEPFENTAIRLDIENPNEQQTGFPYENIATATLIKGSEAILLDEEIYSSEVRCSYDPNDKQVSPIGIGDNNETMLGQELTYTVRFQNTGNDVAYDVSIIDSLDHNLDLSTFEVLNASHEMTTTLNRNVVEFLFKNIFLPDSTSNEPLSHGYVTYSISPKKEVQENTLITNNADIYFDANPPIRTNTTENLLVENFNTSSILSIEALSLDASIINSNAVELTWTVAFDTDNKEFGIERNLENGEWEQIGSITNKGYNNDIPFYSFIDYKPNSGINYYRIKILNHNGSISYSNIRSVKFKSIDSINIFPNPITKNQELQIINPSSHKRNLTIINKLGQKINQITIEPGRNLLPINHLDVGVYFCIVESSTGKETHKLIVSK